MVSLCHDTNLGHHQKRTTTALLNSYDDVETPTYIPKLQMYNTVQSRSRSVWELYISHLAGIEISSVFLENFGRSLEVLGAFRPTQGERC